MNKLINKHISMNLITKSVQFFSKNARKKRAKIFRDAFIFTPETKILDLGSESGFNINAVLKGTSVKPENVYIADIHKDLIEKGEASYGYVPVLIGESGKLPFDDNYFDIVYCSSVIEHVTVPKEQVWTLTSGADFRKLSLMRQQEFANEIKRLGKQFFVQTPYKYFPIESHSWLPFVGWLPRNILVSVLKFTNLFWIKKTNPDWYLLNKAEMYALFEGSEIMEEKSFLMTKSIISVKSN